MTEIDLSSNVISVPANLRRSIGKFADSHPDVDISCVSLMFDEFYGDIWVNCDTLQNSDAQVSKYRDKGDCKWYLEKDDRGWFCADPPSFEYFQCDEIRLTEFPNLHEVFKNDYAYFRFPTGEVCKTDSLNENLMKIIGCFLSGLLAGFNEFGTLKKSPLFRMGVFSNGGFRKYWVPGERPSDQIEYEIPKLTLPEKTAWYSQECVFFFNEESLGSYFMAVESTAQPEPTVRYLVSAPSRVGPKNKHALLLSEATEDGVSLTTWIPQNPEDLAEAKRLFKDLPGLHESPDES